MSWKINAYLQELMDIFDWVERGEAALTKTIIVFTI